MPRASVWAGLWTRSSYFFTNRGFMFVENASSRMRINASIRRRTVCLLLFIVHLLEIVPMVVIVEPVFVCVAP